MKKKSNYIPAAVRKHRNTILNALLKSEKVFVKNTGIEVAITDFNQWSRRYSKNSLNISISFVDTPTVEALDKMKNFMIDNREVGNGKVSMSTRGDISILDLSLNKFDTKASRILHGAG